MYIVFAVLIFGILIGIHELGHFTAAKALGVKVNEFSIGMGPAILKKQKGETQYSLRLLPIGGYCAMEGEDEETGDPRALTAQPAWKKLIILVAGSFMNFLLGFLIIIAVFAGGAFSTPTVTSFMDGCPYESADALQQGDTFYKIDGHRIYFTSNVSQFLERGGDVHDVTVLRGGEKVTLEDFRLTKLNYEGQESPMYGFQFGVREEGFFASLKYSWYCTLDFVRDVWMALQDLISGAVGIKDLSGPVGIVDMINSVGQQTAASGGVAAALENIAYFGAFIAINLAVMNLLPLPALDGGRVFFILLNGLSALIIKKRIPARYEGYVHAAGMALLLGLMAIVMYNDIARIIVR